MTDDNDSDGGSPSLLKNNQLERIYKNLTEQDEDGNVVPLKMQATKEFKERLNEFVHQLLIDCVSAARQSGRKTLMPEDVPTLEDVES